MLLKMKHLILVQICIDYQYHWLKIIADPLKKKKDIDYKIKFNLWEKTINDSDNALKTTGEASCCFEKEK